MDGLSTESAAGTSKRDNAWQRPAKPDTSVAGIDRQRHAKPSGSAGGLMALAVGIWKVTHSWSGLPAVNSASGAGAGARARVQCATGSHAGSSRHDSKMSRRLVMASTWEMLVGGAAPVRAPATT